MIESSQKCLTPSDGPIDVNKLNADLKIAKDSVQYYEEQIDNHRREIERLYIEKALVQTVMFKIEDQLKKGS